MSGINRIFNELRKSSVGRLNEERSSKEDLNEERAHSEYFKKRAKAKKIIDQYSKKQVRFVMEAYKDCIQNLDAFNEVKRDWASVAYEEEIFDDKEMKDFDKLFDAIEVIKTEDAISVS